MPAIFFGEGRHVV